MIEVPADDKKRLYVALELIEQCRNTVGSRAAMCRQINNIVENGRLSEPKALINMLPNHLARVQAHLYSPIELSFTIDYENSYGKTELERAKVAARLLTRDFERSNTDMSFGQGVFDALKYGAVILKQWPQNEGKDAVPVYHKRLLMPWQFGVYQEYENDIGKQSAMCETTMLTMPEVWRRIHYFPDAEKLMTKIKANASKGQGGDENNSYFHQILSTNTLDTSGVSGMTRPGGIANLGSDPNYSSIGPESAVDTVKFHELWVQGEKDYVTLQVIEPDILITRYKNTNALIPGDVQSGLHPYTLIQPNPVSGYFWGNTEISELIEPQGMLATWADDVKRLFGLQVDKILAFSGYDDITDERYDQMRSAGFFGGPPGSKVEDLTPKFPEQALPMLTLIMDVMNQIGGFPAILQGEGSSGVRSGSHASTLLKTGSPRLRDMSLLVERQCAQAADLRLSLMEYKDPRNYWTQGKTEEEREASLFLLGDLPEDRRVSVDSHSSSPIFMDDHNQLVAFGMKSGIVDGHSAIDMLPYPQKELLHARFDDKQKAQQENMKQMMEKYPELGEAMAKKQVVGKH